MPNSEASCFRLPSNTELDSLTARTDMPYRMAAGHPFVIEQTYLDSFDWRLHAKGWRLYHEHGSDLDFWVLSTPQRTMRTAAPPDTNPPLFVADLPANIARKLTGTLETRALLPVAKTRINRTPIDCLNADDKTVARLNVDRIEIREDRHGPWRALEIRYRLIHLKGYDKPFRRLRHFLCEAGSAIPCPDDLLVACLRRLEVEPGRYSARPRIKLAPDTRSDQAMKTVLAALHGIMSENLDGILKDIDSEFLHDFRTATRRARTALGQIRQVFPSRKTEWMSANLAWLGTVTTPLRDLDVHLIDFPVYRDRLPESLRPAFDPLHDILKLRRLNALSRLQRILKGHRYQRFMKDWQAFLELPSPEHTRLGNAHQAIGIACGRRIHKRYDRICAEGLVIDDQSPPEALHELRKHCKKLRYLLELFESCLPSPGPGRIVAALKRLQDLLGDYQDCHVQAVALDGFKAELVAEDAPLAAAIDYLLADLDKRQTRLRDAFHPTIEAFASAGNRSRLHALTTPLLNN